MNSTQRRKPDSITGSKFYIVKFKNLARPRLLWTEYDSMAEAHSVATTTRKFNPAHHQAISGYKALKYGLDFEVKAKVKSHRRTIYIYPPGCITTLQRRAYRWMKQYYKNNAIWKSKVAEREKLKLLQ